MSTLRAEVAASLRSAGLADSSFRSPPAAVFWADPDRLWLDVIAMVRRAVPVLTLGVYDPDSATGPAVWLRAVLADPTAPGITLPEDLAARDDRNPWVIHLPGISRDDFTDLGRLDPDIAPLADLQLRSTWWSPGSHQTWTPDGFLRASSGGLGLDVARDDATRRALTESFGQLIDLPVETLRRTRIDAAWVHRQLVPDEARQMLKWLDQPALEKQRLVTGGGWGAFEALSRQQYGFRPEADGSLTAAGLLARREHGWAQVWSRYTEAPERYPGLPELLDRTNPETLFDPHPESRPSWNRDQESQLRTALTAAGAAGPTARAKVASLEREHAGRRESVWARLGQAPLAAALAHLTALADLTRSSCPDQSVDEAIAWYSDRGHRVDDQAIRALAATTQTADRTAVVAALAVLYDPWVEDVATRFQRAARHGYVAAIGLPADPGTCVVFVDGLRYDLGVRLVGELERLGTEVLLGPRLAAFPTVTPTGQPAVAPLTAEVGPGPGFAAGDQRGRALAGAPFRAALAASGVAWLAANETGDPTGVGWTQTNDIDALGHAHDHKLVDRLDAELALVADRVQELLAAGWRRVVVVTDHGFLLPAAEAPKVELPLHLTEGDGTRKPRTARLKAGQTSTYPTLAWTWDPGVMMVSAPGARAFEAGTRYEHGGLSPQECVVPVLAVTPTRNTIAATIEGLRWTGYRCRVDVAPESAPVTVEIRRAAGDPTSRVASSRSVSDGEARILVSEEQAAEGTPVFVVLVTDDGDVVDQRRTTVGDPP